MNSAALRKASQRLEQARDSYARIEMSETFEKFENAWSDFLRAAGGVFTVLEQGAKGPNTSSHWFSGKVHQRRTDPLLKYMHHARNADEHGIVPIANYQNARVEFFGNVGEPEVSDLQVRDDGAIEFVMKPIALSDGKGMIPSFKVHKPTAMLVSVVDRQVHYDLPTTHLGAALVKGSPVEVAQLTLAYIESMVSEASALP